MRTDTSIQPRSRRSPGVGARLLLAQALVLLAGGATTGVVAVIVGPPLFREHLNRAGLPHSSNEQFHAEEAYRYATAISIAVAIGVAALTALVVTWYFSRRLQHSIAEVASAATAVADGRYDIRVSPLRLGEDFANLSRAFNRMSERLESVETTRRQLFGDLAHEIRTPVSVLKAYIEAVEDGVKTLDPETVAVLNDQASRLVRFSDDFAALAQAEEGPGAVTPQWIDPRAAIVTTVSAAADRYAAEGCRADLRCREPAARGVGRPSAPRAGDREPSRQRSAPHPRARPRRGRRGGEARRSDHHRRATMVMASLPSTSRTCSNASTAPMWPAIEATAARGSGWPSPKHSPKPTAAASLRPAADQDWAAPSPSSYPHARTAHDH